MLIVALLAARAVAAYDSAPVPPPIPGGFADGYGKIGVFAGPDRKATGVNLQTGTVIWNDVAVGWPLCSRFGWVAVATPDAQDRTAFRVRFLRPGDGKVLKTSGPVRIPGWTPAGEVIAGESVFLLGTMNSTLTIRARAALPSRGPREDRSSQRLHLFWELRSFTVSGFRPPAPPGPPRTGLVIVDPATGKVEVGGRVSATVIGPAEPALPPDWKPRPDRMYFQWFAYGGSWTDRPKSFRIGGAILACISQETAGDRRLLLERWRPYEPLGEVEIARGGSYVPDVSLDGTHLMLHDGTRNAESHTLYDLARGGTLLATLPALGAPIRPPFTVHGPLLIHMTEARGDRADRRTTIHRSLNALTWATGLPAWTLPLAPRHEGDPVPGGGR